MQVEFAPETPLTRPHPPHACAPVEAAVGLRLQLVKQLRLIGLLHQERHAPMLVVSQVELQHPALVALLHRDGAGRVLPETY